MSLFKRVSLIAKNRLYNEATISTCICGFSIIVGTKYGAIFDNFIAAHVLVWAGSVSGANVVLKLTDFKE